MRNYIKGTLSLKGKAQRPTYKVNGGAGDGKDEDTEFLNAKECLMIFGGPHVYVSRCQYRINK